MELNQDIIQITELLEQAEFSRRKARSPKSKRARRNECEFWRTMLGYLTELQELRIKKN